ncbi:MAG TPA: prolyl oligopeptidase family serine peptidase [Fimbriimonadaceae bacterium]|nr:prolyl oligopeptidase family serine peptidase [Fimbriimonadaceae bacterium]
MRFALLAAFCVGIFSFAPADDLKVNAIAAESYIRPAKEIEDAVTAPWYRNSGAGIISPDRTRSIVAVSAGLPKLVDMARPYHNLGGLQIDWRANRARNFSFRRTSEFQVVNLADGKTVTINPPRSATLGSPNWSPDGKRIAYFAHFDTGTYIWVADASTGKSKQISSTPVLATLETQFEWLGDSRRIVAVFVPSKRAAMPTPGEVAATPLVKISDDKPNQLRTYAGLMNSPYEFDLLEWHATGQLGVADAESGKLRLIGKPAMIENISPEADGNAFRVTLMERPFSYLLPTSSFPEREVIWSVDGAQLVELSKRPLRMGGPPANAASNDNDKRSITWRPDGQGLSFLQVTPSGRRESAPSDPPEDEQGRGGGQGRFGGGAGAGAQLRPGQKDRVMQWVAPFGEKDFKTIWESDQRINSVQYSEDGKTLFVSQSVNGRNRVSAVRLDNPTKLYTIVESPTGDNSFYEDSGNLVTREGMIAGSVVRVSSDGKNVYLAGTSYSKDPEKVAPKNFLDRVEIETGKKERIFESNADRSETVSMLDGDGTRFIVTRQSPTAISQTYLVDAMAKKDIRQLTQNRDYAPDLTQATRRKYVVTRPDGIKFQVEVTLPAGAKPGSKLPAFFWFYPSEFVDQATYDRSKRTFNKNNFQGVSPTAKLILLRAGYALVEPDCPIIGPDTRKNDGYVPQLRNNLAATIDAICDDGLIDRNKLAIGGHSYGAFSTLNAMVHTPFFKAGIAGDGNYNRLLTPFGFQSEQRQLWESRETYLSMSPMLYLEQLTGAILLYHSLDDQNMGTEPSNSPRLFAALEALGKPAALYMYPYEDHGPIAEETVLDQWARFVAWLDKWVKNGGKG